MRKRIVAVATGCIVAALAVVAVQSHAGDGSWGGTGGGRRSEAQCVTTPLKGSRVIDKRTMVISDWHGNAAVLTLSGPCLDAHSWGVQMKLIGTSGEICRPDDIDAVADPESGSLGVCSVTRVELMSRADAEGRAPGRGQW